MNHHVHRCGLHVDFVYIHVGVVNIQLWYTYTCVYVSMSTCFLHFKFKLEKHMINLSVDILGQRIAVRNYL